MESNQKKPSTDPQPQNLYQHLGLRALPSHVNSPLLLFIQNGDRLSCFSLDPVPPVESWIPFPFACIFLSVFYIINFLLSDGSLSFYQHCHCSHKKTTHCLVSLLYCYQPPPQLHIPLCRNTCLNWAFSSLFLLPTFLSKPTSVRVCPYDYTKTVLIKVTVTSTLLNPVVVLHLHLI